jgi:hypothetical protein
VDPEDRPRMSRVLLRGDMDNNLTSVDGMISIPELIKSQ